MLTAERMREVLTYDPSTGIFLWKAKGPGRKSIGRRPAGNIDWYGRRIISIASHRYYASRLAWLYVHGEWPAKFIDHINLDRADDRIANLREATRVENAGNRRVRSDNWTGLKGVRRHGRGFKASIKMNGVEFYLGFFKDPLVAHAVYVAKAKELYGQFARGS